jgi:DNA-binding CsgD family transcriptional regulator
MTGSAPARATARFKQLSCLGLSSETVIPLLLAELHALVPSEDNDFFFVDARGETVGMYVESPDSLKVLPLYFAEFHEGHDARHKNLALSDAIHTQFGVHTFNSAVAPHIDVETYYRSYNGYNEILRPAGYDQNFLRLIIRGGYRVLGCVTLWRRPGHGQWTTQEHQHLAALEPHFIHALTAEVEADFPMTQGGRIGVIIATADGKVVHQSAEARQLLFLAVSGPNLKGGGRMDLPAQVVQLCRNLSRITGGNPPQTSPTTCHIRNAWGWFDFRAQRLDGSASGDLVAITVTHPEPLAVRLVRNASALPLTRRESEVAVLIANGLSLEKVAERLSISRHTANEHSRWIYNKLDVHNRAELTARLLMPEATAAASDWEAPALW